MSRHDKLVGMLLLGILGMQAAHGQDLADALFASAHTQGNVSHALSASDRQAISALLPYRVLNGQVVDVDCRQDVQPEVTLLDLNGDSQAEVILNAGNSCTDGPTGSSIRVLAKLQNTWREVLSATAAEYQLPATHGTAGWRDIWLLGRSECMGWWRFDGRAYQPVGQVNARGHACK